MPVAPRPSAARVPALALAALAGFGAALPGRAGEAPRFELPLDCAIGAGCAVQNYPDDDPGPGQRDHACGGVSYDGHTGTDFRLADIRAMRTGAEVRAAAAGTVLRVRDGEVDELKAGPPGASDRACGNGVLIDHGGGWRTLYCHMRRGSLRVRPGDRLAAGAALGAVGLSGATQFPHLHFEVLRDDKPVDPFTARPAADDDGCAVSAGTLWAAPVAARLAYRPAAVVSHGFAAAPPDLRAAEAGDWAPAAHDGAALVAFIRVIGVRAGDVEAFRLVAPDGAVLVDQPGTRLAADKVLWLAYAGRRRPPAGWAPGRYAASYRLTRAGAVILDHGFDFHLP